jgi:YVTN family beta-propeller protein
MDKKFTNKKKIISAVVGLLLLVGCENKEWPTDPPDLTRPEIKSTTPEDGSLMNPVNEPIIVEFTEEMNMETISQLAKVFDSHGDAIAGSWSGSAGVYKFSPATPFSPLSFYTVSMKGAFSEEGEWLGAGIRDKNGNSLEHNISFSFSTEGNYGHSPLFLGTGGDNGGIFAYVEDLHLSEMEDYPGEGVQTPAISPSGDKIYVASSDNNKVIVVDVASHSVSAEISLPDGVEGPRTLAVTPNGQEVWVACNSSMDLVVINTSNNQVDAVISLTDYAEDVHSMAINHAGTKGYITTNWDQGVIVFDIPNRTVLEYIEGVATVESAVELTVSPDDSKIIVFLAWAEEEIAVIDAATNAVSYFSLGSGGDGWMLDVEGDFIYANGRESGYIYKINMTDMSVAAETNIEEEMKGIAIDSDGEVIYTIAPFYHDEGAILIFTASDLTFLGSIPAGNYRHIVTP